MHGSEFRIRGGGGVYGNETVAQARGRFYAQPGTFESHLFNSLSSYWLARVKISKIVESDMTYLTNPAFLRLERGKTSGASYYHFKYTIFSSFGHNRPDTISYRPCGGTCFSGGRKPSRVLESSLTGF